MKKIKLLFIIMLFTLVIPVIHAKSVIEVITEGNESNYKINGNYGWTFNLTNTKVTASNYNLVTNSSDAINKGIVASYNYDLAEGFYLNSESDCSSGKIYVLYNNVGMYQGKKVNLKVSVTGCKFGYDGPSSNTLKLKSYQYNGNTYTPTKPDIIFENKAVQMDLDGLRSVDFKYEFLDDNNNKIDIKGYGTFYDLDFSQAFKMENGIDKAYIYENYSRICTSLSGNTCATWTDTSAQHLYKDKLTSDSDYTQYVTVENVIQSSNNPTTGNYRYAWATVLFSGESFNITYYLGEPDFLASWWNNPTNNPTGKAYEGFGNGMFGFVPDSLVPFAVEDPVKSVNKTSITRNEEFTYTTSHRVPYINKDGSNNNYTAYSFNDILEPCLTVKDVSKIVVKNDEGTDVTENFNIKMTESNGSVVVDAIAKADFLSSDNFYGHEYEFIINTEVKANYDLSKYLNSDSSAYVIPNKASISVTDNSGVYPKTTNEVKVNIPIPKEVVSAPDTAEFVSSTLIFGGSVIIILAIGIIVIYKKKVLNKN